jgi:hypothetical protein
MFKLAMGAVLSLGLLAAGGPMADPPTITISPIPPVQGQSATIEYTGPTPASLTITFRNEEGEDTHMDVMTNASGKVTVTVPSDAETMKVVDNDGLADAESANVQPSS